MINKGHITVILLIYLAACISFQSGATASHNSRSGPHAIKEYKEKTSYFFACETGYPLHGILKKNKRPGICKSQNGGSAIVEKLIGTSDSHALMPEPQAIHADRLLKKHLDHNYPSHNFW
jgi:hypothetical protein